MTVRIKPLVWRFDATNHTYASMQGGFIVKHGGVSGWEWRRGHIFGFADSRQGAFEAANERHVYEVSALLETATPTPQLAAALQVPEVAALVEAAARLTIRAEELRASDDTGFWGWEPGDAYSDTVAALAALKGPQT